MAGRENAVSLPAPFTLLCGNACRVTSINHADLQKWRTLRCAVEVGDHKPNWKVAGRKQCTVRRGGPTHQAGEQKKSAWIWVSGTSARTVPLSANPVRSSLFRWDSRWSKRILLDWLPTKWEVASRGWAQSERTVPGRGVARGNGGERSPLPVAGASTGRPPWAPRPSIPDWHFQSRDPRPRLSQSLQPQRPRPATPSPELAGRRGASATTLPSQDLPTSSLSGPVTPGLWPTALACALPEFRISGIRVSLATRTATSRHCTSFLVAIFSEGEPEWEGTMKSLHRGDSSLFSSFSLCLLLVRIPKKTKNMGLLRLVNPEEKKPNLWP